MRLFNRSEYDTEWDPAADKGFTIWQVTQHLIVRLEYSETRAARLLRRIGGGVGDRARRLAYLLYQTADRQNRTHDAVAYNSLIQAWLDIARQAAAQTHEEPTLGI